MNLYFEPFATPEDNVYVVAVKGVVSPTRETKLSEHSSEY